MENFPFLVHQPPMRTGSFPVPIDQPPTREGSIVSIVGLEEPVNSDQLGFEPRESSGSTNHQGHDSCSTHSSGGDQAPQRRLNRRTSRSNWTQEEDATLSAFVEQHGLAQWAKVGRILGKTGKQCRNRWSNTLEPGLKDVDWSMEEEKRLVQLHRQFGSKWALLSRQLPGRSPNAIKNHWNNTSKCKEQRMSKRQRSPILREYISSLADGRSESAYVTDDDIKPFSSEIPAWQLPISLPRLPSGEIRDVKIPPVSWKIPPTQVAPLPSISPSLSAGNSADNPLRTWKSDSEFQSTCQPLMSAQSGPSKGSESSLRWIKRWATSPEEQLALLPSETSVANTACVRGLPERMSGGFQDSPGNSTGLLNKSATECPVARRSDQWPAFKVAAKEAPKLEMPSFGSATQETLSAFGGRPVTPQGFFDQLTSCALIGAASDVTARSRPVAGIAVPSRKRSFDSASDPDSPTQQRPVLPTEETPQPINDVFGLGSLQNFLESLKKDNEAQLGFGGGPENLPPASSSPTLMSNSSQESAELRGLARAPAVAEQTLAPLTPGSLATGGDDQALAAIVTEHLRQLLDEQAVQLKAPSFANLPPDHIYRLQEQHIKIRNALSFLTSLTGLPEPSLSGQESENQSEAPMLAMRHVGTLESNEVGLVGNMETSGVLNEGLEQGPLGMLPVEEPTADVALSHLMGAKNDMWAKQDEPVQLSSRGADVAEYTRLLTQEMPGYQATGNQLLQGVALQYAPTTPGYDWERGLMPWTGDSCAPAVPQVPSADALKRTLSDLLGEDLFAGLMRNDSGF